jgi:hypothetical protein
MDRRSTERMTENGVITIVNIVAATFLASLSVLKDRKRKRKKKDGE